MMTYMMRDCGCLPSKLQLLPEAPSHALGPILLHSLHGNIILAQTHDSGIDSFCLQNAVGIHFVAGAKRIKLIPVVRHRRNTSCPELCKAVTVGAKKTVSSSG